MAEDPAPPNPGTRRGSADSPKTCAAHDLQQRHVSQQGRMLEPQNRDLHDSGRYLHTGLPLLCHQNRTPPCSGRRGTPAGSRKRLADETEVCRRNFCNA